VENKNGITDVLAGHLTLKEAIKHNDAGMDCLNRGEKVPYPTAVLGSEQMAKIFEELRKEYEYIIVDCPPILAVSDAAIVSKLCDGCLFVVSQSKTEKNAARESVKILRDNNVNILGCIFCGITSKGSSYYNSKYKYYYQNYYGKDVNPEAVKATEPMKEEEENEAPQNEEKKD
jgi:capsular exopolysaccharide synthesis family protein